MLSNRKFQQLSPLNQVKFLGEELDVLKADRDKTSTYHANRLVQNRTRERDGLIAELRGGVRIVVDNSEIWE